MQNAWGTWALAIVAFGVFTIGALEVQAVNFNDLRQQLEERRAASRIEFEKKLAEIRGEQVPEPEEETDENSSPGDSENVPTCECSTRLGLARPDIRWSNGVLEVVPRFDLSISVNGDESAPPWALDLAYNGQVNTTAFSSQRAFGAQCFDARYRYAGIAGQPIAVPSILRSAFGAEADEEVSMRMNAAVTGCDSDSVQKEAEIRIRDFGAMKVSTWKTVR